MGNIFILLDYNKYKNNIQNTLYVGQNYNIDLPHVYSI